jgi:predicted nucleotidyltransferase
MTSQEADILHQLKAKLQKRLPLSRLVLFGSRARGDADPDSDMDVLVVLEGAADAEAEDYVRLCAWEAGIEQGIVVVPVTVSRAEWQDGPLSSSLLALAVEKEGVAI